MMRLRTRAFVAAGVLALLAMRSDAATPLRPACAPGSTAMPTTPREIACTFFAKDALSETRALVVLQDGKPVIELYAPGYGPDNRFISWSMAKSVTSTLVGQLVGEGRLMLDAPAPVPGWHASPHDPRGTITLRHLLHMSSGLEHWESSGERPEDPDTNRILFGDRAGDAAGFSIAKPLEAVPGEKFEYSTATSTILADLVQRIAAPATNPVGRRAAMRAHMERVLIRPAGLDSLVCEFDAAGTMLGGSLCHATARDWARFGQLYLDGGRANGAQIVPQSWVAFVRAPSRNDGGYGGQFWLNLPRPKGRDPALFPESGPADAYAAVGHLGQYVIIVPSKRLVVVRLGKTRDDRLGPVRNGLAKLVNAWPDRP